MEEPDALVFTNPGSFAAASVEDVIRQDTPPDWYRNPFLAGAMVNLNMIDTIGSGIKRMFTLQRERYFPMPDYDLSEPQRVKVRIFGKILDENYTRALMANTGLDLGDVIALDKVQKRAKLSGREFRSLKDQGLVEGRRPNLYVAARVAAVTGRKAAYIRNRAFDKGHYQRMVVELLRKFGKATRREIDDLLLDKLSDTLDLAQKRRKVANLLQEMKSDGTIAFEGPRKSGTWRLTEK